LLILDEVTSALDEKTEHNICQNIRAITDRGYIVPAITHPPAWTEIADRLYKIDGQEIMLFENGKKQAVNA